MEQYLHVFLHGGDGDEFEAAVGVLVARGQVGAGEAPVGEGGPVRAAPEGKGPGREPRQGDGLGQVVDEERVLVDDLLHVPIGGDDGEADPLRAVLPGHLGGQIPQ